MANDGRRRPKGLILATGAVLLGGLVLFAVRAPGPAIAARDIGAEGARDPSSDSPLVNPSQERAPIALSKTVEAAPARVEPQPRPARHSKATVERPEWKPMLFLFERELRLNSDQRHQMVALLVEREEEIHRIQKESVAGGIFQRSIYVRRIEDLQRLTYDRMSRALDSAQQRTFSGLLAEGRVGDAIAFEIPDGVQILE